MREIFTELAAKICSILRGALLIFIICLCLSVCYSNVSAFLFGIFFFIFWVLPNADNSMNIYKYAKLNGIYGKIKQKEFWGEKPRNSKTKAKGIKKKVDFGNCLSLGTQII